MTTLCPPYTAAHWYLVLQTLLLTLYQRANMERQFTNFNILFWGMAFLILWYIHYVFSKWIRKIILLSVYLLQVENTICQISRELPTLLKEENGGKRARFQWSGKYKYCYRARIQFYWGKWNKSSREINWAKHRCPAMDV